MTTTAQSGKGAGSANVVRGFTYPKSVYGALDHSGPRKTLVLCPIGIGNFLMLTPALKTLSEAIGSENLHLLALKGAIGGLGESSGLFQAVHTWDPDKQSKTAGLALIVRLKREEFDYSISLFPSGNWKFAVFGALVNAKKRFGFLYPHDPFPRYVQTLSAPLNMSLHDTDQNCDLIEALIGVNQSVARELSFPYSADSDLLSRLKGKRYFVCHPGSSAERGMKEKRLPAPVFADVIKRIDKKYGIRCILIGGPEESELRSEIAALTPGCVLNYSSATFNELRAIIDASLFYLGNDSGLMHTSSSAGKPCIAFFGPTDDRRTGPYDESLRSGKSKHLIVRNKELTCTPCWTIQTLGNNPPCRFGDTRCLKQMEIESVWPSIDGYIGSLLRVDSLNQGDNQTWTHNR